MFLGFISLCFITISHQFISWTVIGIDYFKLVFTLLLVVIMLGVALLTRPDVVRHSNHHMMHSCTSSSSGTLALWRGCHSLCMLLTVFVCVGTYVRVLLCLCVCVTVYIQTLVCSCMCSCACMCMRVYVCDIL